MAIIANLLLGLSCFWYYVRPFRYFLHFNPHDDGLNKYYCPHFIYEETEAQGMGSPAPSPNGSLQKLAK